MITIAQAVESFMAACEARFLSDAALAWYRFMLQRLVAFMGRYPLSQVTIGAVERYAAAIAQEEKAGSIRRETTRGIIRVARFFFSWAEDRYRLLENPARFLKIPPSLRQSPKALPLTVIKQLLEATDNDRAGVRDRAIIMFLLETGCRSSGLRLLRIQDLRLDRKRAYVTEKGGHTRAVPVVRALPYLRAWLAVRPPNAETVFCSIRRGQEGKPLSRSGVLQILVRLRKKAKIEDRVFTHAFRHTLGTEYHKAGGPLMVLKEVMGHQDIRTTQVYSHIDEDTIIELHEKFSPIKRLEETYYVREEQPSGD